jgi:cellulose synthase operon protein C
LKGRQKEYGEALQQYEAALRLAPDNRFVMNEYASVNAEYGFNMERTVPLAAHLYAMNPKDPIVADTLGWTLFRQGKTEEALPLLKQAVIGMPEYPGHHYHFGVALIKAGYPAQGRKALETSLKISSRFDGADRARELLKSTTTEPHKQSKR